MRAISMQTFQRKGRIAFFLALLCSVSGSAFAAGWSGWTTVSEISVRDTGEIWFTTAANINPDACARDSWLIIKANSTGGSRLYAALLSARALSLEINYRVDACMRDFPAVTRIDLR